MRTSPPNTKPVRDYPLPDLPPNAHYEEEPDPELIGDGALTFVEDSDYFDSYMYRLTQIAFTGRTKFQNVLIADTINYGRILVLDGAIQSAADDEAVYHEMLVQPAMLRHPNPEDVLIIGGGEGATLREVLVHRSVKSATMVDIDREVVELCQEHLSKWHRGAFEDPRVKLVFDDGRKYVENDKKQYDVVIIDVVDMLDNGPAQALYTKEFYQLLRQRMKKDGILVVQALEFSFIDDKPHAAMSRTLKSVFSQVHSYKVAVPSFLSSWGFIVASDWFAPDQWTAPEIDATITERLGSWLTHVDGEFLQGCFALDKETRLQLLQSGPIIQDGVEFEPPPNIVTDVPDTMKFPLAASK